MNTATSPMRDCFKVEPVASRSLPPFAALRAFEATGRLGGIRRAAAELGIEHTAVSRHVRALEDWAGTPLFDRRGMTLVLTGPGQRFHQRIADALAEIRDAAAELGDSAQHDNLRVWCVPGFAQRFLLPRIGRFQAQQPGIVLQIRPSEQIPDLARHEADILIAYGSVEGPGLYQVEIAHPRVLPVCSPAWLATHGPFSSPADLLSARLLHEEDQRQWRRWFQACGVDSPANLFGPMLWHSTLAFDAACNGDGVALAYSLLVGDDLRSGRLVEPVASDVRLDPYTLVCRSDRRRQPAILSFSRWLIASAAAADTTE